MSGVRGLLDDAALTAARALATADELLNQLEDVTRTAFDRWPDK